MSPLRCRANCAFNEFETSGCVIWVVKSLSSQRRRASGTREPCPAANPSQIHHLCCALIGEWLWKQANYRWDSKSSLKAKVTVPLLSCGGTAQCFTIVHSPIQAWRLHWPKAPKPLNSSPRQLAPVETAPRLAWEPPAGAFAHRKWPRRERVVC